MTKSAIWRLTRKNVEAAMRRKLPEGRLSDGQGLYLFIRTGGLAQWTFRKMIRGKSYELLIGNVVDLGAGAGTFEPGKAAQASLDEARRKTAEIVNHLNKGGSLDELKKSNENKAVIHTWDDLKSTYIKVKGLEGNKIDLELNRHIKRLQEIAPEAQSILDFTKIMRENGVMNGQREWSLILSFVRWERLNQCIIPTSMNLTLISQTPSRNLRSLANLQRLTKSRNGLRSQSKK